MLTGEFTCEYPGIYMFVFHIMKNVGYGQAYCWIRKNWSGLIGVQTSVQMDIADSYIGISNALVLHLVRGDVVDLGGCTSADSIYSGTETSFSGFLLKAD